MLHVIDVATGKLLPDTIDRTRFASIAWQKDNSGFYYTRHPKKGDVAAGEEVYHVKVFYHALGSDSAKDPLIFGRRPRDSARHSWRRPPDDDDRWLLLTSSVRRGWTRPSST